VQPRTLHFVPLGQQYERTNPSFPGTIGPVGPTRCVWQQIASASLIAQQPVLFIPNVSLHDACDGKHGTGVDDAIFLVFGSGGPPFVPGASASLPTSASVGTIVRYSPSTIKPISLNGIARQFGSAFQIGELGRSVKFKRA
jgi:hypothetical protein